MECMKHIKFINVQQARPIYKYKNTKGNLVITIPTIWFNKMCRANHLAPITSAVLGTAFVNEALNESTSNDLQNI
jgi:hypothetical protein